MTDDDTIYQRHRVPGSWPRGARITDCQRFHAAVAEAGRTADEPAPLPPVTNREMRKRDDTRSILAGIALILFAAVVAYTIGGLLLMKWWGAL